MAKDNTFTLIALGVAGYFLYEYFFAAPAAVAAPVATPGGGTAVPVTATPTPLPATPVKPATPPTSGSIGGHAYTSKLTYQQALTSALYDLGGGTRSLDEWNWYAVNNLGLFGGAGPDPTPVAAQIGIGRNDTTPPSTYVNALDQLGLLQYPSGLSAVSATIQRMNTHPLAGMKNVSRKVVIQ